MGRQDDSALAFGPQMGRPLRVLRGRLDYNPARFYRRADGQGFKRILELLGCRPPQPDLRGTS